MFFLIVFKDECEEECFVKGNAKEVSKRRIEGRRMEGSTAEL